MVFLACLVSTAAFQQPLAMTTRSSLPRMSLINGEPLQTEEYDVPRGSKILGGFLGLVTGSKLTSAVDGLLNPPAKSRSSSLYDFPDDKPSFSAPEMPKFEAPEMPSFSMPKFDAPDLSSMKAPDMPKFDTSSFSMPKVDVPDTPKFTAPKFEKPDIDMPSFSAPKFEKPDVDMPSFSAPDMSSIEMPAMPDIGGFFSNIKAPDLSGIKAPDLSGISTPDLSGIKAPDLSGISAPDLSGIKAPDLSGITSNFKAPDLSGIKAPDFSGFAMPAMPDIKMPDIKVPEMNLDSLTSSIDLDAITHSIVPPAHAADAALSTIDPAGFTLIANALPEAGGGLPWGLIVTLGFTAAGAYGVEFCATNKEPFGEGSGVVHTVAFQAGKYVDIGSQKAYEGGKPLAEKAFAQIKEQIGI